MNDIRAIPKRYLQPLLFVLALIILAIMPRFVSTYAVTVLISIFMYAVLAVSWNMFCAPTNYISLGTAAFFGVGVYASAILQELPLPVVILIAGLLSFSLGLLMGVITLRLKGMYFAIFTFGVGELLRHAMVWYEVNITQTVGRWLPLETPVTVYYYMLIILSITLLTAYLIRRSKLGLALQSIGQNDEASAHIGINVNAVKVMTFALTCFFMGATGAVIATRWSYVDPSLAFAPYRTFYVIIMVLFGGMGSTISGPILGATVVTLLSDIILVDFTQYTMLIFGVILVVIISFLPNGLMGIVQRINNRFRQHGGKYATP